MKHPKYAKKLNKRNRRLSMSKPAVSFINLINQAKNCHPERAFALNEVKGAKGRISACFQDFFLAEILRLRL
jgi:hypothetical protein